jgi:hypothetical protein
LPLPTWQDDESTQAATRVAGEPSEEDDVEFLGIGKGRTGRAVTDTRSALEQAEAGQQDDGVLGNQATRLIQNILDLGIDGKGWFHSASKVADDALAEHRDSEAAVDAIVRQHIRLGGASGFVTSAGGFFTLPVALPANVLGFYLVATRMVAAVARVRGYDLRQEEIRTAVLLTLVGADADDLLKKAGMASPGGTLSNLAAQRLPGPAMMVVQKGVGFRLLATVGKNSLVRLGKIVPIVGGVIGAGLDSWMQHKVAVSAKREFPPARPAISAGSPAAVAPLAAEPAAQQVGRA